jgi:hypothetical protein
MSAYVVVEFTVKDPDAYREKYGPNAGRTAKEYGGEVLANANWEILHGDGWRPESGVKGRARFQFMVMLGDGADILGTVVVPGRGYGACPELAGRFGQ